MENIGNKPKLVFVYNPMAQTYKQNLPQMGEHLTQTFKQLQPQKSENFPSFLRAIKYEINNSRNIYNQFLQTEEILKILGVLDRRFIDKSATIEIVGIVLDFLSFCKKEAGCQPPLNTIFTQRYPLQLAHKWMKIREETYNLNKSHLRILSYIVEKPKSGKYHFGSCFQSLKFDFTPQESKKVAAIAFKMAKEDIRSFCFLSNYFLISSKALQRKGAPLGLIKQKYEEILIMLSELYRPAPQIFADDEMIDQHKNFEQKQLIPNLSISLKGISNRQQTLENFIMERAEESISHLMKFYQMMKEICQRNGGFRFKGGVKIEKRSEHKALLRIKEKMLANYYNLDKIKENMRTTGIKTSLSIDQAFVQEKTAYEKQMENIFETLDHPIDFKVSDMLRGKCLFAGVDKINDCCNQILESLKKEENKDLKLIEIDNRLKKSTSDLVIKILFGNVITELQLVINLNAAEYAFGHKIYELMRSKFFTPFTQLSILNEGISNDYLTEARAVIEANTKTQDEDNYEQEVTFSEVSKYFQMFLLKLPINIEKKQQEVHQMDLQLIKEEQNKLKKILGCKIPGKDIVISESQTRYQQGKYFLDIKDIGKAEKKFKEAEMSLEKEQKVQKISQKEIDEKQMFKSKIYLIQGDSKRERRLYIEAIDYYLKCLEIQEKIKGKGSIDTAATFNSIGSVYDSQGHYPKAIQYLEKCLKIQERIQGNGVIDTASTLRNIGSVYDKQGYYPKAIDYYFRCLEIQERIKGKGDIDTAVTLNNIGSVYYNQGFYPKAIEYYSRCLEIQEKIKGKGTIVTAVTLSNIGCVYNKQGFYPQAIQYYSKCLEIKRRIKGKGDIDTAISLSNIGSVFEKQKIYPKAIEYYSRCLQIQERIKGKGDIETAITLNNIGSIYNQQGYYFKAIEYYSKCLEIQETIQGKDSIATASTFNNLGSVYDKQGDYPKAIQYFTKCLQIKEKIKGNGDIAASASLKNIGSVYYKQKQYGKAIQYYSRCLQIQETILGSGDINTTPTLSSIGSSYYGLGDHFKAIQYYSRALQIQEKIKGKEDIDLVGSLKNIGNVYHNKGQYSQAIQYYSRCLEIEEKIKGKGQIEVISTLNIIGSVYDKQGNFPKAIQYYSKCLEIQEKIKGKGSIVTVPTLNNIGLVYDKQRDFFKAVSCFQRCLQIQEKVQGKNSNETAGTLNNIGLACYNQGDYPKAISYFVKCLQIKEKTKGKGDIETSISLRNIGNVYDKQGDFYKAIQHFTMCLQIQERIKGKGSYDTASTFKSMGIVFEKQGQYPKAIHYFKQSVSIYESFNLPQKAKIPAKSLQLCLLKLNLTQEANELSKKYGF